MISLDVYLLEFVRLNFVSLTLFIGFLKGMAKITKNVHDDKIVTLIELIFGQLSVPTNSTTTPVKR